MDERTRRDFLRTGGIAGALALAGCGGPSDSGSTPQDSDGDGVIDSEDYAPRDPDVQRAEQVGEATTERAERTAAPDTERRRTTTTTETEPAPDTPEVVFADDFADSTVGEEWTVVRGEFAEEFGSLQSKTPRYNDIIHHDASAPYHALEYTYRHGATRRHLGHVLVASANSDRRWQSFDGNWPVDDLDLLRIRHNRRYGSYRAALIYTPADYHEDEIAGEILATWGDAANLNDDWHRYRVERHPNELRFLVDGDVVASLATKLPESAWTGRAGAKFYSDTFKLKDWRMEQLR